MGKCACGVIVVRSECVGSWNRGESVVRRGLLAMPAWNLLQHHRPDCCLQKAGVKPADQGKIADLFNLKDAHS